ncbi:MAG: DUF58 domain-containing protein [Acidocella sp.]|nr:DUF58 domain-containing protein [Acidocella sp.]
MIHPATQAAETLAAGLPDLVLAAERLAFAVSPGHHQRRRAGPGTSFWQFREWQHGDDSRAIDWRRSAQGDRLFLRQREAEAQAGFALVLEDTPTLDYSSHPAHPTKRDRAGLLLLALAALLLRAGERVALAGRTPPLAGRNSLVLLAATLGSPQNTATDPQARHIRFGDYLTPVPAFTAPQGGAILHILDPAECDFPFTGRVIFTGLSGEAPFETTDAAALAVSYRARIAAQRQAVINAARSAGQTALFHRTDHAPALALSALYQSLRAE